MTKEETEKLKKALEDFLNAPQVDAKSVNFATQYIIT